MIIGLGNLVELKAELLSQSVRYQTTYDAVLAALGRGVTRQFETRCNRLFARVEAAKDVFNANREHWICRRYPVEEVSLVEINSGDGFTELPGQVFNTDPESGIVRFNSVVGVYNDLVRATYTGGYWVPDGNLRLEEDGSVRFEEDGDPRVDEEEPQPEDSTAVPDDLKHAWLLQCKHTWDMQDRLCAGLADNPNVRSKLAELELVPVVEKILRGYVRYNMS